MEFLDYYSILNVSSTATEAELREAYRQAARRYHPDVNSAPGAEALFRDINTAYEALSDPARRVDYDRIWKNRAATTPSLVMDILLSRTELRPMPEPQILYVLVKVQPLLEMSLSSDAPLNLCLVIDRSTSMKGMRLQNLKSAVHHVIDHCSAEDFLSVVTFSDNAEVLIPAQHPGDPRRLMAAVSSVRANGATAIRSGLDLGLREVERHRHSRYVNHLILITDGRTYGDEDECIQLARKAHERGIGISGVGIGEDWNDRFLDELATKTGGSSTYINAPETITWFLDNRIRSLATAFAERMQITVAPTPSASLQSVTRIEPNPMGLAATTQPIPLGSIEGTIGNRLMLQFHMVTEGAPPGPFAVGRVDVGGEVLGAGSRSERVVDEISVTITDDPAPAEPPPEMIDALSRLALSRLQDRANEALEEGDIEEAAQKLEYLATRLLENGSKELGEAALDEARRVARTQQLSAEGAKNLKYGTRALWSTPRREQ
jgi:Ca-activated chloride channel family protein